MKHILVAILCMVTSTFFSQEKEPTNQWISHRPDAHAPISVMGDHMHHKGEFMFSYRYMTMDMRQLRQGTRDAANMNAFANYMVAPQNMTMNMHMLGVMYAPSNKTTLMVMTNYIENNMDLQMMSGMGFNTNSSGFGDVLVSALYSLFNKNRKAMHVQIGVSIPTGSIDNKDILPMSMGNKVQLPYPMQTGTGSFGTKLGFTFLGQCDKISWGHQLTGMININDNNQDYKFDL